MGTPNCWIRLRVRGCALKTRGRSELPGGLRGPAEQGAETALDVHRLLSMHGQEQVFAAIDADVGQRLGSLDLLLVAIEDLLDGVARDEYSALMDALPEQVVPAPVRVRHQDVAGMVDDAPVHLLRNAVVEAAVSRLHVEDGNPAPFRHVRGERAVCVSEHEQPVGRVFLQQRVDRGEDVPDAIGKAVAGDAEEPVRRADAELLEEHVAQRRVEVLPRVHEHEVGPAVEALDDAAEPDDLRSRSEDGEDSHRAGSICSSGIMRCRRSRSATAAASTMSSEELYSVRSNGSPSISAGRSSGRMGEIAR